MIHENRVVSWMVRVTIPEENMVKRFLQTLKNACDLDHPEKVTVKNHEYIEINISI